MRKRTIKLRREWQLKVMRTCWEAIRENSDNDKQFVRKMCQISRRMQNLDLAKAFQHWHHTA